MGTLSTHVLDTALGLPAVAVTIVLTDGDGAEIGRGVTDANGRVTAIGPDRLPPGDYRLTFDTAGYFASSGRTSFYPEVTIVFTIADPAQHYHVPVLLSPYGYSTYRGN